MNAGADPEAARRAQQILWATLLAAQVVYLGVIVSGVMQVRSEPLDVPTLPIALAALAVAVGIGAHVCWRRASGAGRALHETPPEPATAFRAYLIAWVLDESIAIYGLVLALLGFGAGTWGAFCAGAFLLLLRHRPA